MRKQRGPRDGHSIQDELYDTLDRLAAEASERQGIVRARQAALEAEAKVLSDVAGRIGR